MSILSTVRTLISCLFLFLIVGSCRPFKVQDDQIKSMKRMTMEQVYEAREKEEETPLLSMKQTLVKNLYENGQAEYNVYDVLSLDERSFRLERKLYWVIDDEVFVIDPDYIDQEQSVAFDESTEDLTTVDSTQRTVITGYQQNNERRVKLKYTLGDELISDLRDARELLIRYYIGPETATIRIRGFELNKYRQLIDAD